MAEAQPGDRSPPPGRGSRHLPRAARLILLALILAAAFGGQLSADGRGPAVPADDSAPRRQYTLRLGEAWWLDLPGGKRFDASGLCLMPDGSLLCINDKGGRVYRIRPRTGITSLPVTEDPAFTPERVAEALGRPIMPMDGEGLARDDAGRIYVCDEGRREILRFEPGRGPTVLPINWAPVSRYFSGTSANASFEGVAVGDGMLYVANERSIGRIIAVRLVTMKVVDDFQPSPRGIESRDIHYSDLSYFEGRLWVLCRQSRCILEVEPASHRVVAEFSYRDIELNRRYAYATALPFGFAEGLAVDGHSLWLCVDNNGLPRSMDRQDHRPVLFRCPRPDKGPGTGGTPGH